MSPKEIRIQKQKNARRKTHPEISYFRIISFFEDSNMPFSNGQKIFALVFLISFIAMLILAYRSDAKIIKIYYKDAGVVLAGIAIIMGILILLIKLIH